MNRNDKTYDFPDMIRLVAAVFVLLIHCPIDGVMGDYITAVGRFAVPYFILISGYFSDYTEIDERKAHAHRSLQKMAKLLLKLAAFYVIINSLCSMMMGLFPLDWLFPFTGKTLMELIAFNRARFLCPIIYYLLAEMYVILIDSASIEHRMLEKLSGVLIIPLLLVNICLNYFTNLPWYYAGNWLLTFLPLHLIGKRLHRYRLCDGRLSPGVAGVVLLAGIILSIVERTFIGDCYFSFGALMTAVGVILLGLNWDVRINHSAVYRHMSEVVFCVHYAVMQVIATLAYIMNRTITQNELVAGTLLLSVLIACIFCAAGKHRDIRRRNGGTD